MFVTLISFLGGGGSGGGTMAIGGIISYYKLTFYCFGIRSFDFV